MTPSVGRIVHCYRYRDGEPRGPLAAIVTDVGLDTIDVAIFHPLGETKYAIDVPHVDGVLDDARYYWEWPPRV